MAHPARALAVLLVLCGLLAPAAAPAAAASRQTGAGGGQVIHLSAAGGEPASALAFSSDGRWLAVGTRLGIHLYDAQSLAELRFIPTQSWVRSLAFSPNGQWLADGAYESSVRVWRVSDGAQVRELIGHSGWVHSVAFAPDGETLASAGDDNTVRLWRLSDGAQLAVLSAGVTGPRAVAFSPDGATLATGGYDAVVRLWHVPDGRLLRELTGHSGWVRCLAFSPDGQTLASGGFDMTARLWRVRDGAPLRTLSGHTATVMSVAFSPDGATLATGSTDKTVRLWGVADGQAKAVFTGHTDLVFDVAFATDGQRLASASTDSTVRLWPLSPDSLAQAAAQAAPSVTATTQPAAGPNCPQCHHPQGSSLSPNSLQPARVVEVSCAVCHTDGPLVRSWDPTFPRAPGPTTMAIAPPVASDKVGLPHATADLNVELATPGNGETLYSGGTTLAFVPVAGQVKVAAGQASDVQVRLEVWSGTQQLAAWSTRPGADGHFSFALNVNPDQSALSEPIDRRDCLTCHDPNYEAFSVGAYHSVALPAGDMRLLLTATNPSGEQASDERWVTVDPGGRANVSVHTVLDGAAAQTVAGLPVQAVTRLYQWRGRTFAGTTGADGTADFQVEALAAASTQYTFQVAPTVINGELYQSVAPVVVTLAPGATSLPPVTLTISARAGRISGQLAGSQAPLTIHAIHLPEGTRYDAQSSAAGLFAFESLPIGQYEVLADAPALTGQGLASVGQTLDLAADPQADVRLTTTPLAGRALQGTLSDDQGRWLPFGWISLGPNGTPASIRPDSGAWALAGVALDTKTIVASAPGFFSQAQVLPADSGAQYSAAFQLKPLPGMRRLPWGSGAISLPPETQASSAGQQIELESGWLWGSGATAQPWVIHTAGTAITLNSGRFALVNLPGQGAWLYLPEGTAQAQRDAAPDRTTSLTGPAMLALGGSAELKAVPLDAVVLQALPPGLAAAGQPNWEPGLAARLRDGLALLGIRTAQILTFITYLSTLLALIVVPLALIRWRSRHPQPGPAESGK